MTGEEALLALIDNPVRFLRRHQVQILSPLTHSGIEMMWFGQCHGDFAGAECFAFSIDDDGVWADTPMLVYIFGAPTLPSNQIDFNALPGAPLDQIPSASILCTAQLSGCAIVMQRRQQEDGGPFVAHIWPRLCTGEELELRLVGEGAGFQEGGAATFVYGKLEYPNPWRSSVIGVKVNNRWGLYAQRFNLNTRTIDQQVDVYQLS